MIGIAITGHRPSKDLFGGWKYNNLEAIKVRKEIEDFFKKVLPAISEKENDKDIYVHDGLACGVDMYCIDVLNELRGYFYDNYGINLTIIGCIPYLEQPDGFDKYKPVGGHTELYYKYFELLGYCDESVEVDKLDYYRDTRVEEEKFSVRKLEMRNHYMVDNSKYLLPFWNFTIPESGRGSGTYNCIKYAMNHKEKKILIAWDLKEKVIKVFKHKMKSWSRL